MKKAIVTAVLALSVAGSAIAATFDGPQHISVTAATALEISVVVELNDVTNPASVATVNAFGTNYDAHLDMSPAGQINVLFLVDATGTVQEAMPYARIDLVQ